MCHGDTEIGTAVSSLFLFFENKVEIVLDTSVCACDGVQISHVSIHFRNELVPKLLQPPGGIEILYFLNDSIFCRMDIGDGRETYQSFNGLGDCFVMLLDSRIGIIAFALRNDVTNFIEKTRYVNDTA